MRSPGPPQTAGGAADPRPSRPAANPPPYPNNPRNSRIALKL